MRLQLFLLILTAAAACAQQPAVAHAVPAPTGDCPIGFTAQQQSGGSVVWTVAQIDRNNRPDTGNLGVHVQLDAKKTSALTQVELKVHYKPIHAQTMLISPDLTQTEPNNTTELTKTYDLASSAGGTRLLSADLLLGPVAYISHVTLSSIHYADGTAWQPGPKQSCVAVISHVIPVANRQ